MKMQPYAIETFIVAELADELKAAGVTRITVESTAGPQGDGIEVRFIASSTSAVRIRESDFAATLNLEETVFLVCRRALTDLPAVQLARVRARLAELEAFIASGTTG